MEIPDTGKSFFYASEPELAPLSEYAIQSTIGEGAHGVVLSAVHNASKKKVAIKKVPLKGSSQDQASITREIQALQECRGQHVVDLLSSFTIPYWMAMIFECCLGDLSEIISTNGPLQLSHVKSYAVMILQGLDHIHSLGWMHRDIKPSNLLIGSDRCIKIADFGLARKLNPENVNGDLQEIKPYSNQVASRWYRAPELLYGSRHYDTGVDTWAAGCVIAEMIEGKPLFSGRSDIEQLTIVHSNLGTPTMTTWPELEKLPDYGKLEFSAVKGVAMNVLVPKATRDAVDLLEGLITYSGGLRKSAKQALQHEYFSNSPEPTPLGQLPIPSKKTKDYGEESIAKALENAKNSNLDLMVIGVPMKLSQRS